MYDSYNEADLGGDYLQHFGVPGMKWGVRRYQPYKDASARAENKEIGKAARKAAKKESEAAKAEYKQKVKAKLAQIKAKEKREKIIDKNAWKTERKKLYADISKQKKLEKLEGRKDTKKAMSILMGNAGAGAVQASSGIVGRLVYSAKRRHSITNAQLRQIRDGSNIASKLNILEIK